jgi:Cys-rich protein (TIGR01571 family)
MRLTLLVTRRAIAAVTAIIATGVMGISLLLDAIRSPYSHITSLCGCCHNCGTFLLGWFLPCILFGRNHSRLRGDDSCVLFSILYCVLLALFGIGAIILGAIQRGEIRHRYNVHGSGCGDCCVHMFCTCCALIQESDQLELSV